MEQILRDFPFRAVLSLKPLLDHLTKTLADPSTTVPCPVGDLQEILKRAPELYDPIEDLTLLERHRDLIKRLMGTVFSPVLWDTDILGAVVPFSIKPFLVSPNFERLFLDEDGFFVGRTNLGEEAFNRGRVIRAYLFILKRFYGIRQDLDYPLIRIITDPETGLDRHFKMKMDFRFVEVVAAKEPKALTDDEHALILEHITEPEVLREVLPPQNFELRGFTVLQAVDVTDSEVLSGLERHLIDQESIISQGGFLRLQQSLRTLFRRPGLVASIAAIQDEEVLLLNSGCDMTQSCIFADSRHVPISEFKGTWFERAVEKEEILRIPDLMETPFKKRVEEEIVESGVRSLLIAPLHYKGECIGTLDIGSPRPGDLGPMDALRMIQIQPLFSMALKHALDDLESRVQGVIKEKCTAVHPAVEWRFRKAAVHHLEVLRMGQTSEMEPIIFKDVYPLYGVSDIRGSSDERNQAIQKDLAEHLSLGLGVIRSAYDARSLPILLELAGRIHDLRERIRSGLGTGDELSVVRFLQKEVESLFSHLKGFGLKVIRAVEAYESAVDPKMGTVYRLRKEFEESVSVLNDRLATYLDQEEAEAQTVFQHYFERHRTDGVDYLIYMGASLREEGDFHELYLKNLRLWQLKVACGMAWQTEQLKSTLKVPLDAAHLILVQDSPLSIRFRFDEKRFDVDGTYDIRHEIIKSRIDKAVVRGGTERLTQPGKIAIVYSHPEEAREMRRHIRFLQSEGFLNGELETLDLEELPGIQGLKSLRVGINLESSAISERLRQMRP
jgi:hypothetical protein